jgi:N-acetylglucosaminyldiphosphoundecaprenol N-acetyl-beta-D-mannosaminyltransferase
MTEQSIELPETRSHRLPNHSSFPILGVRVDAVQIPDVIAIMEGWIDECDGCHYVAVTGMHGITEAHRDSVFKAILNTADLVVPDGMPLVWVGRFRGKKLARRVYGPELMMTFCRQTTSRGYRHFFFGGAPGLPEKLSETLRAQCPGLQVAGTFSPPFSPVSSDHDAKIVDMINRSAPDILWVGLSTPKQERWMHQHRDRLDVPVVVGVGAAFDINSGNKKQAPAWMREHGLEWLFRLLQEPRRLWRRYIIYGAEFLFFVSLELAGIRRQ